MSRFLTTTRIGQLSAIIMASIDPSILIPTMKPSCMKEEFHELINHVFQMMFVSGETADVTPESTSMIESIVQQQVMEMVSLTNTLNTTTSH